MTNNSDTSVGILDDVTGEYFTAKLLTPSGKGQTTDAPIGQVGSYFSVKHLDVRTLVSVDRSYSETGPNGTTEHRVHLTPLGEINTAGEFTRGISHFPTSGAALYNISNDELKLVFSRHSDADYKVGSLTAFEDVDVYLDASAFFGRHAAIFGQSGSGKSWTVTSLIQSALTSMPNAHIILIDMHGEYCDKTVDGIETKSPFEEEKVRSFGAQELEFPHWLLTFSELCELLIDPEDENASMQISFLRSVMVRLKKESNDHLELGHITVDSPIYYSMDLLIDAISKANNETSNFGKTKSTLFGRFDQILVRMQSLLNDSRYDFLMKPKIRNSTESLTGMLEDLVGLGEPRACITVLDLSSVPFDVVPMVTAQIGRLAYEFNFWNPRCTEFPIFLICEEAHEYIPRADIPRYREARRSMERIAKNGRKYGVGLCIVSQRPHDVSETVLAQCSSFICLRISNPDDQDYVRAMVPDAARGTFAALTSLAKGEAVALGEAVPMPVRFNVNMPSPPPNSTDVDYAAKWQEDESIVSVEKIVQNWCRQKR